VRKRGGFSPTGFPGGLWSQGSSRFNEGFLNPGFKNPPQKGALKKKFFLAKEGGFVNPGRQGGLFEKAGFAKGSAGGPFPTLTPFGGD